MADTPQESAMKAELEKPRPYGTGYKLIGKNYHTPDLVAKVTGRSKYAEDFRAEGMLFCRLVLSPMPHGRIRHIDASEALAMPGVKAVLTADDIPAQADYLNDNGQTIKANKWGERALTNQPMFQGDPILAVAAVDELTCAEAIEKIKIDMEPLPFVDRSAGQFAAGGTESARGRKCVDAKQRRAAGYGVEVDQGGFCRIRPGAAADGQANGPVVVRRSRCRLPRCRTGAG